MTNSFACALGLLLATYLPIGSAFVVRPLLSPASRLVGVPDTANNKQRQQKPPTTSTTLYYRDDVPPIGSTSTWETPNDFNQFLTQCSIQSFMFLLDSLRDDQTLQWLNDFTAPVVLQQQRQQDQQSSSNTTAVSKTTPPSPKKRKVSLEQAALSAVTNTDQLMTQAIAEGRKKKKNKTTQKKDIENKKSLAFRNKKTASKRSKKTRSSYKQKKKTFGSSSALSMACRNLLDERASSKAAFASYSKMMRLLSKDEGDNAQDDPVTNTDISALYAPPFSGIPRKQPGSKAGPKNSYSPFASKTSTPSAAFSTPKFAMTPKNLPEESVPNKKAMASPSLSDTPEKSAAMESSPSVMDDAPSVDDPTVAVVAAAARDKDMVLKYHGLAMLNCTKFPTWDAYFETLLDQPKEYYTIESLHPNFPSYDLDIEPTTLCSRMLSVRTQIAAEFEHDLEVIANMGELMMMSYHKMLREIREQRGEEKLQQQKDELEKQIPKSMEESISNHNGAMGTDDGENKAKPSIQRANLLFLDSSVTTPGAGNDGIDPSPLRRSNFDLLVLLATQEAIHRVLNDPSRQARKSAEHGSNQFLQDFYMTRLLSHFSGNQRYGRADDFLEEMLTTTPRMISADLGKGESSEKMTASEDELTKDLTYLVDPVSVAETILAVREKVALEWKGKVAEDTKAAHMAIQKMVLAKVMSGTEDTCKVVDSGSDELGGESGTECSFE